MVGIVEPVHKKIRCNEDIDIRANHNSDNTIKTVRIISGSGTPSAATTGSLAAAGSIYQDMSGSGDLFIKTSQPNGTWVLFINHSP